MEPPWRSKRACRRKRSRAAEALQAGVTPDRGTRFSRRWFGSILPAQRWLALASLPPGVRVPSGTININRRNLFLAEIQQDPNSQHGQQAGKDTISGGPTSERGAEIEVRHNVLRSRKPPYSGENKGKGAVEIGASGIRRFP